VEVHARDDEELASAARVLDGLGIAEPNVDRATRRLSVAVDAGPRSLMQAVRLLDDGGVAVDDIALRRPTLDEVFLALTGTPIAA
jgi:ABC-2 type transport system ATP-binding protein